MATDYMIPCNDEFIEDVAKSLARTRLEEDASLIDMKNSMPTSMLSQALDDAIEKIWAGLAPQDDVFRRLYRSEAQAAIRTINLKLLTLIE